MSDYPGTASHEAIALAAKAMSAGAYRARRSMAQVQQDMLPDDVAQEAAGQHPWLMTSGGAAEGDRPGPATEDAAGEVVLAVARGISAVLASGGAPDSGAPDSGTPDTAARPAGQEPRPLRLVPPIADDAACEGTDPISGAPAALRVLSGGDPEVGRRAAPNTSPE